MDYFLFLAIWVIFLTAFWFKDWPKGWPIQESEQIIPGLVYAKSPDISLRQWGLHIAPEKVQQDKIVSYL